MNALTASQYAFLVDKIQDSRVRQHRGNSHLEAWDIRRNLIRAFGFGGYDVQTKSLDLVAQIEHKPDNPNGKSRWTVVYRAEVRLIIKAPDGTVIAVYEDGASGDSQNQPSLGDAHDQAMKTALSQGLKRCAVNLGDQFGLCLYNDGQTKPVVIRSLVTPGQTAGPSTAALPTDDDPVLPEPGTQPRAEQSTTSSTEGSPQSATVVEDRPKPPSAADVRDWALKPGRTGDEIRGTLQRLQAEHPAVAKRRLQNEVGNQEELAAMLSRLADAAPVDPPEPPAPDAAPMATEQQLQRMHILFGELGFVGDANRPMRIDIVNNRILKLTEPVDSTKKLTASQATQVINALESKRAHNQRQREAVPA